jgi:hypothetical protein
MSVGIGERLRSGGAAAVFALGTMVAGCSSDRLSDSSASPPAASETPANQPGSTSRQVASGFTDFFLGGSSKTVTTSGGAENVECPGVDIRTGASTLILPPGGDAMTLRYQGSISEMARSCRIIGSDMKMKVGVQGRIILGPGGGPGKLELPMRFAVVREGPEPKTILTKFYKVPVIISEGQANLSFTHIDEDITFPMPSPTDLDFYVVYVGFDPTGASPPAKKPAVKPTQRRAG